MVTVALEMRILENSCTDILFEIVNVIDVIQDL